MGRAKSQQYVYRTNTTNGQCPFSPPLHRGDVVVAPAVGAATATVVSVVVVVVAAATPP